MLYRVLQDCAARIRAGRPIAAALARGRAALRRAGFSLEYLEVRNAANLGRIGSLNAGPARLLVAAKLGQTRLIDNVAVRRA
jgi:pantoate--beta-alanine ligase